MTLVFPYFPCFIIGSKYKKYYLTSLSYAANIVAKRILILMISAQRKRIGEKETNYLFHKPDGMKSRLPCKPNAFLRFILIVP